MSIENTLERIAAALEAIVEIGKTQEAVVKATLATTAGSPKTVKTPPKQVEKVVEPETPPAEEPKADEKIVHAAVEESVVDPLDTPEETAEKTWTSDEVRAGLKAYRDIEGSAAMMEVLKNHGAENMSGLKPERYAEVMKIIQ